MNICFISIGHISKLRGGIDRVTDVLSKELIRRKHNVNLISLWPAVEGDEVYKYQYFLPSQDVNSNENRYYLKHFFKEKNIQVIINQAETASIFKLLKSTKTNIPIISCIHTDPLASVKSIRDNWDLWKLQDGNIKFIFKSPYYITRYVYQKYTRKKHLKNKYKELYKDSDAVVLLSEGFKKTYCKLGDITNKEKLHSIGNPDSFENSIETDNIKKENIVLFVGRLEFSPKRCDRILKIWTKVEEKTQDWNLVILGDGPDKEKFYKLKEKLKLRHVTFTGTVNPIPYYKKAKISCITSTHEGFSLAATESLQYNVVPIAFGSYEALYDIIDNGKNGFIIEPFDLEDFSNTILRLINSPSLLTGMQKNISNREKRFEKGLIVDKWENLLNIITKNE